MLGINAGPIPTAVQVLWVSSISLVALPWRFGRSGPRAHAGASRLVFEDNVAEFEGQHAAHVRSTRAMLTVRE